MLCDFLSEIAPEFREQMADSSRYSFGKRLWTEAASEGVSPDDPAAVEAFMDRFNTRPGPSGTPSWARASCPPGAGLPLAGSRLGEHRPGRQTSAASVGTEQPGSGRR